MQWQSFAQFIDMDGSGYFVWGSYGLFFVLILTEVFLVRTKHKAMLKRTKLMLDITGSDTPNSNSLNADAICENVANDGGKNES